MLFKYLLVAGTVSAHVIDVQQPIDEIDALDMFGDHGNCYWAGHAPLCDGKCSNGYRIMQKSKCGDGFCCQSGHKVLCCPKNDSKHGRNGHHHIMEDDDEDMIDMPHPGHGHNGHKGHGHDHGHGHGHNHGSKKHHHGGSNGNNSDDPDNMEDMYPGWVCRWSGTAPFCSSECEHGWTMMNEHPCGNGMCCATGRKALCCKKPTRPMTPDTDGEVGIEVIPGAVVVDEVAPMKTCRWTGVAPFCQSQCEEGWTMEQESQCGDNGDCCLYGKKALCCTTMTNLAAGEVLQEVAAESEDNFPSKMCSENKYLCCPPSMKSEQECDCIDVPDNGNGGNDGDDDNNGGDDDDDMDEDVTGLFGHKKGHGHQHSVCGTSQRLCCNPSTMGQPTMCMCVNNSKQGRDNEQDL